MHVQETGHAAALLMSTDPWNDLAGPSCERVRASEGGCQQRWGKGVQFSSLNTTACATMPRKSPPASDWTLGFRLVNVFPSAWELSQSLCSGNDASWLNGLRESGVELR
ncbi:hypothetical protein SRHO_G00036430 [Serrasalmus rhombeus]